MTCHEKVIQLLTGNLKYQIVEFLVDNSGFIYKKTIKISKISECI